MFNRGFRSAFNQRQSFKNFYRTSQQHVNMMSLSTAQSTLYGNQIRMMSAGLVPLNMRLISANLAELEEEEGSASLAIDNDDDTLSVDAPSTLQMRGSHSSEP